MKVEYNFEELAKIIGKENNLSSGDYSVNIKVLNGNDDKKVSYVFIFKDKTTQSKSKANKK